MQRNSAASERFQRSVVDGVLCALHNYVKLITDKVEITSQRKKIVKPHAQPPQL